MKKNEKKIKINDHSKRNILIITVSVTVVLLLVVLIGRIVIKSRIKKEIVVADNYKTESQEIEWLDQKYEGTIDVNDIISQNKNDEIKEIIETMDVELEYETEYQNNNKLPKGTIQVLQQGQDGKQELIIKKQYKGEELIQDEQIGRKILKPSIKRIVEVGTSKYYNKHKIKVGDTVYATPYELDIRIENDKNAEVIIKINQHSKLKIEKKKGSWYYVKYDTYYGWVEADCVTYIVPDTEIKGNNNNEKYSKEELLKKLSKNMDLNKPSGLTLEQFEKIFENESKDKNGIFKENAKYFYYIEQSYGINGVFVAAIGVHESAWGTSKIAINKKNLFGYGAYDNKAYSSAYYYDGCSASIDMIARVLVKHYLNPKGTSIYGGETATGKYYNGATLTGVNKKYATDKNWSNSIYTWMKYLYNRL